VSRHQKCTIHVQLLASLSLLLLLQFPLIIFLHLLRTVASLRFVCKSSISLSITSFHVFLGIPVCLAPSASKVTHFFYSVFICPYHCNLFLCTTCTLSSIPNHCLNSTRDSFCLHEPPENRICSDSPFLRLYQRREK